MIIQESNKKVRAEWLINHQKISVIAFDLRHWDTEEYGWWKLLLVEIAEFKRWVLIRWDLADIGEEFKEFSALALTETCEKVKGKKIRASLFVNLFSTRLSTVLREWQDLCAREREREGIETEKNFGAAISDPGQGVEARSSGREFWYEGDV